MQRFKGGHTQVTVADGVDLDAPRPNQERSERKPREDRRERRRNDDRRNDDRRERRPRREQSRPNRGNEDDMSTAKTTASDAPAAAKPAERQAPTSPSVKEPAAQRERALGKALEALRALMVAVVASYEEPISLRRLQNRMIESVPTFDHKKLGYARFIDFVRGQDAVEVLKTGRTYRVTTK